MADLETKCTTKKSSKPVKNYYAVAVGRNVGIFRHWSEAQASTDKYPGACHQSFATLTEARNFLTLKNIDYTEDIMEPADKSDDKLNDNPADKPSDKPADKPTDEHADKPDDITTEPVHIPADKPDKPTDKHADNLDDMTTEPVRIPADKPADNDIATEHVKKTCPVCSNADHEYMIKCADCAVKLHFECTQLPPYQLSILRHSHRKFTCSFCTSLDHDIVSHLQGKPTVEDKTCSSEKSAEDKVLKIDNEQHVHCLQAIRNLESSLVEKLCGVMKENYELKLQMIQNDFVFGQKEVARLTKLNDNLVKENTKLNSSKSTITNTMDDKLHKLRTDMEQCNKNRQHQWRTEMDELKKEIKSYKSTQQHQEALMFEKERQIASLQEQLVDANTKIAQAKDEAYEAKRLQTVLSTDEFVTVSHKREKTDKQSSQSQTPTSPSYSDAVRQNLSPASSTGSRGTGTPSRRSQKSTLGANSQETTSINTNRRSSPVGNSSITKPSVVVIGNSHISSVDTKRLVPQADVSILKAFTIDEAATQLDELSYEPDCIVIHEITNDIRNGPDPNKCADYFQSTIDYYAIGFPNTQFIISLGLPRLDDTFLNTMTEIVNAFLKGSIPNGNRNVSFCDHSNFTKNGLPHRHLLLSTTDGYHLSTDGTRVLCSNLRCQIEQVLHLRSQRRRGNYSG